MKKAAGMLTEVILMDNPARANLLGEYIANRLDIAHTPTPFGSVLSRKDKVTDNPTVYTAYPKILIVSSPADNADFIFTEWQKHIETPYFKDYDSAATQKYRDTLSLGYPKEVALANAYRTIRANCNAQYQSMIKLRDTLIPKGSFDILVTSTELPKGSGIFEQANFVMQEMRNLWGTSLYLDAPNHIIGLNIGTKTNSI